jgi:DNA-binding NarL/FixJ family response regulator
VIPLENLNKTEGPAAASPLLEGSLEDGPQADQGFVECGQPIRVLIVDDHLLTRQAISFMLRREKDLSVVGELNAGPAAISLVAENEVDVVIVDVNLPGMNGIEATRIVRHNSPRTRVIGYSVIEDESVSAALRAAGASGYVSVGKTSSPGLLAQAIRGSCVDPGESSTAGQAVN